MKEVNCDENINMNANVELGQEDQTVEDQTATPKIDDLFEENQGKDEQGVGSNGGDASIYDVFHYQEPEG